MLADAALPANSGVQVIGALGHSLYLALTPSSGQGTRIIRVGAPSDCWPSSAKPRS